MSYSYTCPNATVGTDTATLLAIYTGSGAGKQLLPSSAAPSDRESNNLLKASTVTAWLGTLKSNGVLPVASSTATKTYNAKVDKLLDDAKNEYCFYYTRYKAALDTLFNAIQAARQAGGNTPVNKQQVEEKLDIVQKINIRINDLLQIMNAISNEMINSSKTLEARIKEFTEALKSAQEKIDKQNTIIQSNEATMRLEKEMVKYSEQKANYSNNLLKMYSFLNIMAFGLLIYVYKAASD